MWSSQGVDNTIIESWYSQYWYVGWEYSAVRSRNLANVSVWCGRWGWDSVDIPGHGLHAGHHHRAGHGASLAKGHGCIAQLFRLLYPQLLAGQEPAQLRSWYMLPHHRKGGGEGRGQLIDSRHAQVCEDMKGILD